MDNIPSAADLERSETFRTAKVLAWIGTGIVAYGLIYHAMRTATGGR